MGDALGGGVLRGGGVGQGQDVVQVLGYGSAGGGAFGGEVGEHAGEFGVTVGALGELGDPDDGHAGEQALQDRVPPQVRFQVAGGVRTDGGCEEPGVVGAQGVLDEGRPSGPGTRPGRACRTARRSSAVPRW